MTPEVLFLWRKMGNVTGDLIDQRATATCSGTATMMESTSSSTWIQSPLPPSRATVCLVLNSKGSRTAVVSTILYYTRLVGIQNSELTLNELLRSARDAFKKYVPRTAYLMASQRVLNISQNRCTFRDDLRELICLGCTSRPRARKEKMDDGEGGSVVFVCLAVGLLRVALRSIEGLLSMLLCFRTSWWCGT